MISLCGRDCNKCVLYKDYCGGCSMCEASICKKNCKECSCMCPTRPKTFFYLKSIGDLQAIKENNHVELPFHIPVIPDRLKTKFSHEIMTVIGVHGGNMLSRNGEKVNKVYLENGYAKALNVDEKCKAILQFYVRDRTLEGFWDNRKKIYEDLKKLNFMAIISPNFSVYEDAPRVDHLYNMKRTCVVYNEMIDKGISAIPDISWYNYIDLKRWCDEINRNNVKVIAFSFQVVDVKLKASNLWKSYILGFRYLCQNISSDVNIIVIGAASYKKVIEIYKAAKGQKIHILNQSAYVQSRRATISEGRIRNLELPMDLIFERNIKYFNKVYKDLNINKF